MQKITNKIFISILLIVLSAIVLGTTTYAWFSLSNTNTVDSFNASVTAGEGMEITLDNTNWYTSLSTDVINDYLFEGYDVGETHYNPKYTNFKYYTNTSLDGEIINGYGGSGASGYIEFTIKIRTSISSTPVVYWKEVDLSSDGKGWVSDVASFIDAKGVTITPASGSIWHYAADSTRISVKGTNESPVIFELPTTVSNTILGSLTESNLTDDNSNTGANGAVNYFKEKTSYFPIGAESVSVPATVTTENDLDNVALVTLNTVEGSYHVGTVTIRIWIEGWDPDCFNSVLGDTLTVGLVFEARQS